MKKTSDYLATSRPTAVNLFWALNRMVEVIKSNPLASVGEVKRKLFVEAERIRNEDVEISRKIGNIGFSLMKEKKKENKPLNILTHCNAGTLATAKYGTATAPIYRALNEGWTEREMEIWCDETRPLLQGARLTAFELQHVGIKTHLQCDKRRRYSY